MRNLFQAKRLNSIASEPTINRIPTLHYDPSEFLHDSGFHPISPRHRKAASTLKGFRSQPVLPTSSKKCACPHILICDDESFQHLFYANFFSHMIDYHTINIPKEELKISMHTSGEDLINNFQKMISCGCGKLKLVITDFYMGSRNMNGMETVLKLRELGFGGAIILRTSDSQQEITQEYPAIEQLLSKGELNCLLSKSEFDSFKTALAGYL